MTATSTPTFKDRIVEWVRQTVAAALGQLMIALAVALGGIVAAIGSWLARNLFPLPLLIAAGVLCFVAVAAAVLLFVGTRPSVAAAMASSRRAGLLEEVDEHQDAEGDEDAQDESRDEIVRTLAESVQPERRSSPTVAATTHSYYLTVCSVERDISVEVLWTGPRPTSFRFEVVGMEHVRAQPPLPWSLLWSGDSGDRRRLASGSKWSLPLARVEGVSHTLSVVHFPTSTGDVTVEPNRSLDVDGHPKDVQDLKLKLRAFCEETAEDFTVLVTIFDDTFFITNLISDLAMDARVRKALADDGVTLPMTVDEQSHDSGDPIQRE